MVSTWTEYLCLSAQDGSAAQLEICQYEVLADVQHDEDGEPLPLPVTIKGVKVVSVDHGNIIGGELQAWSEDDVCHLPSITLAEALAWVGDRGFKDIDGLYEKITLALAGLSLCETPSEQPELPPAVMDRIQSLLSSPSFYPTGLHGTMERRIYYESEKIN